MTDGQMDRQMDESNFIRHCQTDIVCSIQKLKWKKTNKESSQHNFFHRFSTHYHLTTCEPTFKFLLAMSLTTAFSFFST